ncbi:hypothetical protein FKM82_021232 [Ascaphus truei]
MGFISFDSYEMTDCSCIFFGDWLIYLWVLVSLHFPLWGGRVYVCTLHTILHVQIDCSQVYFTFIVWFDVCVFYCRIVSCWAYP